MEETLWKYVEKLGGGKDTSGLRKFKYNFCCKEFGGSYTRVRGRTLDLKSAGIGSCTKITIAERARAHNEDEEHMSKRMKAANQPLTSTFQQRQLHSSFNIATREEVDEAVARCFYANGLSFNVARSPSFVSMISAISAFGRGYKPLSSKKIRTTLLKRERSKVDASSASIHASWSHTRCSIISDGWTNTAHRLLINIMVSSPRGSVFLRAIDASGEVKSSDWINSHLKDAIMEVGSSNVVQVITDSASNCVAVGEKVNAEFPWVFWTPCSAHCLNLLMKDLTKNAWMGLWTAPMANAIIGKWLTPI